MRALLDIDFKQSRAGHSHFTYKKNDVYVSALIYVDDVICVGNSDHKINEVKKYLNV